MYLNDLKVCDKVECIKDKWTLYDLGATSSNGITLNYHQLNNEKMKITVTLSREQEKYFKELKYSIDGKNGVASNNEVINHALLELLLFEKFTDDQLTNYLVTNFEKQYKKAIRTLDIGEDLKPKIKTKYSPKTRADLANPLNNMSHAEALKLAGVKDISKNHEIIRLSNGKIVVRSIKK